MGERGYRDPEEQLPYQQEVFFRDVLQEMSSVITPFRIFSNTCIMKIGVFDHCFIAKISTSSIRLF